MPLLGKAAMLLSFDIVPEAVAEHDHWHTHEHLQERLSIAGFVRATRWVALAGQPRYFIVYEVAELAALTSAAYLERLNNPTPWTSKIMPCYRGMARGFCAVTASFGLGNGHAVRVIRFRPDPDAAASLRRWLVEAALPPLASQPGIGGAHLFESAQTPPMTNEQRIRGRDAGVDSVLLLTGYDHDALAAALDARHLEQRGAQSVIDGMYRLDYSLSREELAAAIGRRE